LVREFNAAYGGYPVAAIVGIGVAWTVGTLMIGIMLSRIPGRGVHTE